MIQNTEIYQEILDEGRYKGIKEGDIRTKAFAIIRCLEKRLSMILPREIKDRITSEQNLTTLDAWFDYALVTPDFQTFRNQIGI